MKKILGIVVVVIVLLIIAGAAGKKGGTQTPADTTNNTTSTETTPTRSGGELDDVLNDLEDSFEADPIDDSALIDAIEDESVDAAGGSYEI